MKVTSVLNIYMGLSALVFFGCSTVKIDKSNVHEVNSLVTYNEFLSTSPKTKYRHQAALNIPREEIDNYLVMLQERLTSGGISDVQASDIINIKEVNNMNVNPNGPFYLDDQAPLIDEWLGISRSGVIFEWDDMLDISVLPSGQRTLYISLEYPVSEMVFKKGTIITFYSDPQNELKFQWGTLIRSGSSTLISSWDQLNYISGHGYVVLNIPNKLALIYSY